MEPVCIAEGCACCHESHETYNGWTNRETWAVHLYITNDEGLYGYMREEVRAENDAAGAIRDWFEAQAEILADDPKSLSRDLRMMLTDIGSLWRVNWQEVAEALAD